MNLASTSVRQGHLRGFTLIELLVVIAIIGILSSVVLASLNTARNKGADAAIKSNLSAARAEAEIYYDSKNNAYTSSVAPTSVCAATGANVIGDSVTAALTAAGSSVTLANACQASASAWAAVVQLKAGDGDTVNDWYCVDSAGYANTIELATQPVITDFTCS
ncbi:MAG: type II secretion system protein [Patescibacteria group bacterium]